MWSCPSTRDIRAGAVTGIRNDIESLWSEEHAGQELTEDGGKLHEAKGSPAGRGASNIWTAPMGRFDVSAVAPHSPHDEQVERHP